MPLARGAHICKYAHDLGRRKRLLAIATYHEVLAKQQRVDSSS